MEDVCGEAVTVHARDRNALMATAARLQQASGRIPPAEQTRIGAGGHYAQLGDDLSGDESGLAGAAMLGGSVLDVQNHYPVQPGAPFDLSIADFTVFFSPQGRFAKFVSDGLQSLLEAFRAYENDVENLIPAPVESRDSYDRFVTIMRRINEHLYPAFMPDSLIPLYVVIVVQWLKGFSLAAMIRKNIEYHNTHGRKFVLPMLIRQTMEHVEQVARFKAPKYLSAYMDILHLHYREIGREDLIDTDLDIGTQLEFGVSTRTLLSLMELGLSRMSAVSLYEKIARDNLTKEECMEWVRERDDQFDAMDIPAIIVREIREKILATDQDSPDTFSP